MSLLRGPDFHCTSHGNEASQGLVAMVRAPAPQGPERCLCCAPLRTPCCRTSGAGLRGSVESEARFSEERSAWSAAFHKMFDQEIRKEKSAGTQRDRHRVSAKPGSQSVLCVHKTSECQ